MSDNAAKVVPLREGLKQPNTASQNDSSSLFQGIPVEAPPCPTWLSEDAKKHWRYIVKHLKDYGLISRLDQGTLSILCTSYARMKEAEEQLQREGSEFQETPNGYQQLSPAAVSFERHAARYNKLAAQFGMTVRARQNVKVDNPDQGNLEL